MKIALPLTAASTFAVHYGEAKSFQVYDVDQSIQRVRRRLIVIPQASKPCQWPRLLHTAGANLILAGAMSQVSRHHMQEHAIEVLDGVEAGPPEILVAAWLNGTLSRGESLCPHSAPTRPQPNPLDHAPHGHCCL
jgi:predicted Fe-Mo cluster-binding NifX family protein